MDSTRAGQKRTRIACRPCRQNKIRCGMRNPPCERCSRLDIECTIEPHFRRSNQRDRVRRLESHVQELHQALVSTTDLSLEVLPEESTSSRPEALEPPLDADRPNEEQARAVEQVQDDNNHPYRIGPVALSVLQADRLHNIFFCNYHPMVPFLNDKPHAAERYRTSPFLFWSIIAVAARKYDADPTLLSRLTPALEELMHTSVLSDLSSVAQIQAVVLLGYWPLPNYRFLTNKSLLYSNIAVTSSMQLGLHRPGREQEYSYGCGKVCFLPDSVRERKRTWVATMLLSQGTTTNLGLPPTIPTTDDTAHLLIEIPTSLRQSLRIQKCSHQIVSRLASIQLNDSVYARLESLEKEASSLQDSIGQELTFTNSIRLAYAKLFLQCMYFLPVEAAAPMTDELQQELHQQRKNGVLRAYTTAISLITTAISHRDSLDELLYAPTEIPRMILAAALVAFRVLHSTFAVLVPPLGSLGSDLMPDSGRTVCGMACFAIQRCSVQRGEEMDIAARIVGMLKRMWHAAETDTQLQSQEPVVRVTSRMGAGVLFDCLNLWRHKYKKSDGQQNNRTHFDNNLSANNLAAAGLTSQPQGLLLPDSLLPGSPSLTVTQSNGWENMAWDFSDSFCQDPEDWSLYGFL